ncbi:MAG: helix-turn-helix domain-containing protein, partial [Fusicatenibacter sp.]
FITICAAQPKAAEWRLIWNLENQIHQISEGEICLLPPYFTHSSLFLPQQNSSDVLCYFIFFNPDQLLAPLHPNGVPEEYMWYRYTKFPKHMTNAVFSEEIQTVRNIIRVYEQQIDCYRASIIGLVEYLLVQLYRRYQEQTAFAPKNQTTDLLNPAISYLNKEYPSDLSPAFLAQLCGLTEAQFAEKIKDIFHQTPRQYINLIRINKACQLLCSTEETILTIALMTGFTSLSSFNRVFLKITGQSPSAFRNEQRVIAKKNPKHIPYSTGKELLTNILK